MAWRIVGCISHTDEESAAFSTPVIADDEGTYYQQIDLRSKFGRYQLLLSSVAPQGFQCLPTPIECDPFSDLIIYFCTSTRVLAGSLKSVARELALAVESCNRAVQLQHAVLTENALVVAEISSEISIRGTLTARNAYISSLSASAVIDIFMDNLKDDAEPLKAIHIGAQMAAYTRGWELDPAMAKTITPMLDLTKLSFYQFSNILRAREPIVSSAKSELNEKELKNQIKVISQISRQEGRISRLLSAFIENPIAARYILENYNFSRQFESFVSSRLRSTLSASDMVNELGRRELEVARLVRWLLDVAYPASRGALLSDLARELGWNEIVRTEVERVFLDKRHTWSVSQWSHDIINNLDAAGRNAAARFSSRHGISRFRHSS